LVRHVCVPFEDVHQESENGSEQEFVATQQRRGSPSKGQFG
jgi:hypothetical protein